MKYFLSSIQTWSYWRYALLSIDGLARILAVLGGIYLLLDMLDFFSMYTRDKYSAYSFFVVLSFAVVAALLSRRPISRISYRIPKKDFSYEVLIGDLLDSPATNIVISTNTTFDTDIASGLINPDSLQGKFTNKYFLGNTVDLDKQVTASLKGVAFAEHSAGKGKKRRYPVGTVAKVSTHGKTFYLSAMAELNEEGTAKSTPKMLDAALEALWEFLATKGELGDTAIGLIGTGRGRVGLPRKKVIEKIAQSFADASYDKVFSNKLSIVVFPGDAERFGVNLFEVRDYLAQSLQV
ncbi:macro domain-containing protein [Mesorhizobium sp. SP-1A]|uniref:macro domain-containing protein n=1 Tax=Mesorhizobium sp. SP-1A TaxID=3077840 RepID=UPI0028F6EFED|nr:macro domain-containing protein [Mesorhizobium sp. SP-1A]